MTPGGSGSQGEGGLAPLQHSNSRGSKGQTSGGPTKRQKRGSRHPHCLLMQAPLLRSILLFHINVLQETHVPCYYYYMSILSSLIVYGYGKMDSSLKQFLFPRYNRGIRAEYVTCCRVPPWHARRIYSCTRSTFLYGNQYRNEIPAEKGRYGVLYRLYSTAVGYSVYCGSTFRASRQNLNSCTRKASHTCQPRLSPRISPAENKCRQPFFTSEGP